MKSIFLQLCLVCLFSAMLSAQAKLSDADIIKADLSILEANKKKIQSKDTLLLPAYKQLLMDADKLLKRKLVSVMDKTAFPPSGNKHDYMSIAPYWWPDSSKPDGLPYIRKDGEVNPEVHNYPDKESLPRLCEDVYTLSLAYYFSGQERYASKAAKLLQVWFLDTATFMHPNLNYGQSVKGVNEGRAEGLIDTRNFIYVTDAIRLINGSKNWSEANQAGMKKWFSEFLTWMQNSKIGKDELKSKNNHGVWYDAQSLALALFVDSNSLADKIITRAAKRLDMQMDENGLFPLELERTTSLHYSVFILNAFNIIAELSKHTKTDFWTINTPGNKSLKKAFEAIIPYLTKEKEWTWKEIKEFHNEDAYPILMRATTHYGCTTCMKAIEKNSKVKYTKLLVNLL